VEPKRPRVRVIDGWSATAWVLLFIFLILAAADYRFEPTLVEVWAISAWSVGMFWTGLRGLLARRGFARFRTVIPLIIATIALAVQLLLVVRYWADWFDLYP
jgi:hypothetical protein